MINLYQLSHTIDTITKCVRYFNYSCIFTLLVNMSWIGWVNQWEVFRTLKCLHERLFENYVLSAIFLRNRLDLETKPSIFDAKKKKKRLWFRPTYKLADFFKKIPSFSFPFVSNGIVHKSQTYIHSRGEPSKAERSWEWILWFWKW